MGVSVKAVERDVRVAFGTRSIHLFRRHRVMRFFNDAFENRSFGVDLRGRLSRSGFRAIMNPECGVARYGVPEHWKEHTRYGGIAAETILDPR